MPRGEAGEFCTRGYSVMLGYWLQPDKTAEAIDADGWMHTGDLATMDADGYVNITGRLKDMVIRGGENVSPREIEEFLHTHDDIRDVQVIGVPDPRVGEEIMAWIQLRPGAAELTADDVRDFAAGTLAHYKIPRYVHDRRRVPHDGQRQGAQGRDARGRRSSCSGWMRLRRPCTPELPPDRRPRRSDPCGTGVQARAR